MKGRTSNLALLFLPLPLFLVMLSARVLQHHSKQHEWKMVNQSAIRSVPATLYEPVAVCIGVHTRHKRRRFDCIPDIHLHPAWCEISHVTDTTTAEVDA